MKFRQQSLHIIDDARGVQNSNLDKDVNCPQDENSELCNVLKIALFVTMDDQKYGCQILV